MQEEEAHIALETSLDISNRVTQFLSINSYITCIALAFSEKYTSDTSHNKNHNIPENALRFKQRLTVSIYL